MDFDRESGKATDIPLELLDRAEGITFRDQQGNLRLGISLRG